MSCHGCATKFGIFTKERGCPNCGFAFCSKCLRYTTTAMVGLGGRTVNVCRTCCATLTSASTSDVASASDSNIVAVECDKPAPLPPAAFLSADISETTLQLHLPAVPDSSTSSPSLSVNLCHNNPCGNGVSALPQYADMIIRRLESLENPARPPIVVYHHDARLEELRCGLHPEDRHIVDRLERLRKERRQGPPPTEEEILSRLEALKGAAKRSPPCTPALPPAPAPDHGTVEERTNRLIKQLLEEQIMRAKHATPEDMIATRLARLRASHDDTPKVHINTHPTLEEGNLQTGAFNLEGLTHTYISDDDSDADCSSSSSDDNTTRNLVDRTLHEVMLDIKKGVGSEGDEVEKDPDELPWCVICNEDATVRCLECDGDLFCQDCFAKGHDDHSDMRQHRTVPFKAAQP